MVIAIGGKNDIACQCLQFVLNSGIPSEDIKVVPNPSDKGVDGWQRSLLAFAQSENLNVCTLEELYQIEDLVFFSLEYEKIIKVEKFRTKLLFNIHFSLLPEYKGMFTSCLPILEGKSYSGVTLHLIERGIDTGDIVDQQKFDISNLTAFELYHRYTQEGKKLFQENFKKIINRTYKCEQQVSVGSTYYSKNKIDFSTVQINFNATANQINDYIKAFTFRPFQLVKINGMPISHSFITDTKSKAKTGSLINQEEFYFEYATIDYNIKIFTDQLDFILKAAETNNLEFIMNLYKLGYRLDEKNEKGWNASIVAAYNNSFEVLEFLIENGCDLETINYKGTSLMMYAMTRASMTDDLRCFKYLLSKGGNIEHVDYAGISLTAYAAKLNNSEVMEVISSVENK